MQVAEKQFVKTIPVKETHPSYFRSMRNFPGNQAFNQNLKKRSK